MAVESVRAGMNAPRAPSPGVAKPSAAEVPSGFPDLSLSGTTVAGEFRCADCGYGVVVQRSLPVCPMCGGTIWERSTWSRSGPPPGEPLQ